MVLKKRGDRKEVVVKSIISKENLPLPYVHYPRIYGTFIGFSKSRSSQVFFCSCSKKAIMNYIKLKYSDPLLKFSAVSKPKISDGRDFPATVVKMLIREKVPSNSKIMQYLRFKKGICHACNNTTPDYTYCHPMYGVTFVQNFGWYLNQGYYEQGIYYINYLPKYCPKEISKILEICKKIHHKKINLEKKQRQSILLNQRPSAKIVLQTIELQAKIDKKLQVVHKIIENKVRDRLGYSKIGEGWTSETMLYYIIKKLYPKKTVLMHYKPGFLGNLELDIFIKELNTGIEYQGIQHFKEVAFWGGEEGLDNLKKRDKLKKRLCKKQGIKLILFSHKDDLSERSVKTKIDKGKL